MTEDASDSDEEFFEALTLLHSTENDSEEKLRRMLDTVIQREYGFEKTLIARMPIRFLQNARTRQKSSSSDDTAEREGLPQRRANICRKYRNRPVSDTIADSCVPVKAVETESDDCDEEGDIPTISIPDEGSTDGLLCKVLRLLFQYSITRFKLVLLSYTAPWNCCFIFLAGKVRTR